MKFITGLKLFMFTLVTLSIGFFVLFVKVKGPERNEESPCIDPQCVRFCEAIKSQNMTNSDSELGIWDPFKNVTQILRILIGNPCKKMKFETDQWKFSVVSCGEKNFKHFPESRK